MDRVATPSLASTTSFRINGDAETFDENDAVIANMNPVLDDQGRQKLVIGIARLRHSKIYRYGHMSMLLGT